MPKVGIVISNYNGWQDTVQCLQSLEKQTFRDFEIILLDDASPNDSVARLREHLPPNTVFLPQEQNLGFAAVNNIGMRRALADGCVARIEKAAVKTPPIFSVIQKAGEIPERDMFNTFNMGVGMTVIVPAEEADEALRILRANGEDAYFLG